MAPGVMVSWLHARALCTTLFIGFTRFFRFFFNIISFRHVLHFGVGRSQIEWNMKVKGQILICTAIMLNNHSNPYIESTTVLSDTFSIIIYTTSSQVKPFRCERK